MRNSFNAFFFLRMKILLGNMKTHVDLFYLSFLSNDFFLRFLRKSRNRNRSNCEFSKRVLIISKHADWLDYSKRNPTVNFRISLIQSFFAVSILESPLFNPFFAVVSNGTFRSKVFGWYPYTKAFWRFLSSWTLVSQPSWTRGLYPAPPPMRIGMTISEPPCIETLK